MIIIYNLSGLLVGVAGVFVGFATLAVTRSLGLGVLALAVVWFVLGLGWRYFKTEPGVRRSFPALFFIPLPFLAVPLAPLAGLIFLIEVIGRSQPPDPRAERFRADEAQLDSSSASGDVALSKALRTGLQEVVVEGAKAESYSVFTRKSPDVVLVLMKVPNLRDYTDNARKQLLQTVVDLLRADDQLKDKKIYIGIKGKISFGATRVPPDVVKVGSVVSTSPLYEFYENEKSEPEKEKQSDPASEG